MLGLIVYYNLWRDFWWTYTTLDRFGPNLRSSDNWNAENYAQFLYGSLAMICAIPFHFVFARLTKRAFSIKDCVIVILAASAAIPVWNEAGRQGQILGESLRFSEQNAAYFAAIFTGVGEGPTQVRSQPRQVARAKYVVKEITMV